MRLRRQALGFSLFLVLCLPLKADSLSTQDLGRYQTQVALLMMKLHYERLERPLNDSFSRKVFLRYLNNLDPDHVVFIQSDIEEFEKLGLPGRLDDEIQDFMANIPAQRPLAAVEVYQRYRQRLAENEGQLQKLSLSPFNFNIRESFTSKVQGPLWPKKTADKFNRLRLLCKVEVLMAKLRNEDFELVKKQWIKERLDEVEGQARRSDFEVVQHYLDSVAEHYDRHSRLLSDFGASKFLTSVGAVDNRLGLEVHSNGRRELIVRAVVPESPAAQVDGLKVGARLLAISKQGGAFVSLDSLGDEEIKATLSLESEEEITLRFLPSAENSQDQVQEITVPLRRFSKQSQQARAYLVEEGGPDSPKFGVIRLPFFYADLKNPQLRGRRDPNSPFASDDVMDLVQELQKQNVAGIILDLSGNPGGVLEETVDIVGIFAGNKPVMQVRDSLKKTIVLKSSRFKEPLYTGPLLVRLDGASASGSEILAGALQDLNRAVVIGSQRSYGKATVQGMIPLKSHIPKVPDPGLLKLTMQKFYRITGESSQRKGVLADVPFPTPFDNKKIGEAAYENTLAADQIDPVAYVADAKEIILLAEVARRSRERVAQENEFRILREQRDFAQDLDLLSGGESIGLREADYKKFLEAEVKMKERHSLLRKVQGPRSRWKILELTRSSLYEHQSFISGNFHEGSVGRDYEAAAFAESLNILDDFVQLKFSKPGLARWRASVQLRPTNFLEKN